MVHFVPKVRIEVAVPDDVLDKAVETSRIRTDRRDR